MDENIEKLMCNKLHSKTRQKKMAFSLDHMSSLIKEGATCSGITAEINSLFEERNLLQYRSFGYGHSFGVLSHYYGREAGLELREDIDTELTSHMVVSMEPMITIPDNNLAAGGYREHDILVLQDGEVENITKFPYGPEHNIISP